MVERGTDQADGLRRMFSPSGARVIEIVAGEPAVGRTALAVNLGAALARLGRHTLLIDAVQARGASRVPSGLRLDVADAQRRRAGATDPDARPFIALELVSGRDAAKARHEMRGVSTDALLRAAATRDCVLVSSLTAQRIVVAADGQRDVLIVVSPVASSITTAYALVKRIVYESGACRLRVVVNRVDSAAGASRIFKNFARVALGYLDVRLELAGFLPADPSISQAAAHGLSVIDWNANAHSARALHLLAEAIGRTPGAALLAPDARAGAGGVALPLAS